MACVELGFDKNRKTKTQNTMNTNTPAGTCVGAANNFGRATRAPNNRNTGAHIQGAGIGFGVIALKVADGKKNTATEGVVGTQ